MYSYDTFKVHAACGLLFLSVAALADAHRFQFQGPILTLTLKDPYQHSSHRITNDSTSHNESEGTSSSSQEESQSHQNTGWWRRHGTQRGKFSNVVDLHSLAPNVLYSVRTNRPLPNYFPSLQSASLTAQYNYNEIKNKPNFIEGDIGFHSKKLNGIDFDTNVNYNVAENASAVTTRIGSGGSNSEWGCFGLARFILARGKSRLSQITAQYKANLPFPNLGQIQITPTHDFDSELSSCTCIGKSGSGRTAAVLHLDWYRPSLSFLHAIDQRNTIQPEISLLDAKIVYNWSVALESGSMIKTRVDPMQAVQITWIDQARDGKWVTDFKLPLTGQGPLAGDIRVRRQFVF